MRRPAVHSEQSTQLFPANLRKVENLDRQPLAPSEFLGFVGQRGGSEVAAGTIDEITCEVLGLADLQTLCECIDRRLARHAANSHRRQCNWLGIGSVLGETV